MNSTLIRLFWSLLIHAAVLALAVTLIYFLGGGQDAVAESVRERYADRPAQLEAIRSDSVWQMIRWCIYALAASWIFSGLWLLLAERHMPRTPREGAQKQGLWVMLLIASLVAMAILGWANVFRHNVQSDLAADTLTTGMLVVGLSTFLAYFLATAMSVKTTMRPSVPFAGLLPSLSRHKA
jgi:hypothetical protein